MRWATSPTTPGCGSPSRPAPRSSRRRRARSTSSATAPTARAWTRSSSARSPATRPRAVPGSRTTRASRRRSCGRVGGRSRRTARSSTTAASRARRSATRSSPVADTARSGRGSGRVAWAATAPGSSARSRRSKRAAPASSVAGVGRSSSVGDELAIGLPVEEVLPDVVAALDAGRPVVLQAPPGAGKTTLVPLALRDRPWVGDGRILVLEPRRLAARAAARRMSQLVNDGVGGTVGYVTRDERQVSRRTVVEVVTEGILVRRLQRDPSLPGVSAVLFDEFHERSLAADLGLALTLEARSALRDDLRIVVMSATLDGERVAAMLDDPAVISSEGRRFPVETRYRPRPISTPVEDAVADAVDVALLETEGDVLVFLPGAREIRRVASRLAGIPDVLVAPLYGALPPAEQDRALDPAPAGRRKVVLATDIAETSLTIEGVRVVVDGGLTRAPRFDPRTGMSALETVRISQASADQRRGRAGRVAPGVAFRCWAEREQAGLDPHTPPEIAVADLAGLALEVASWGAAGPEELPLPEQPPAHAYAAAVELLRELEALDDDGRITPHGRALAELPLHPRLAHLVVRGTELGLGGLACDVAALLSDRDILSTGRGGAGADLTVRVRVLRGAPAPAGTTVRRGALSRAKREAGRLRRLAGAETAGDPERTGGLVALAYPDRVAQRRGDQRGTYRLASGKGARLFPDDVLAGEELLAVADVDLGASEARIWLAAAVSADELREVLSGRLATGDVVAWDDERGDVVAEWREHLGAVVLARSRARGAGGAATAALLAGVRSLGLDVALPWDRATRELRERIAFVHRTIGDPWPDVSDEALLASLEDWLAPFLAGATRRSHLGRLSLREPLLTLVGWERVAELDRLAPERIEVPSGSAVRLDYSGDAPVLPVKLQEMFGATETPTVAGGRVPVTIHLLSPAQRPVQVTADLASFWRDVYPQVRAELRGRYPKHPWPEDPLHAPATRHTKRRAPKR
ncbi:MAG: ATP-dependent helicase HrpB [Actinobacteria bacterium]|nr:ATP-dependent helicase HrpB [Actinomycetota bacterium]